MEKGFVAPPTLCRWAIDWIAKWPPRSSNGRCAPGQLSRPLRSHPNRDNFAGSYTLSRQHSLACADKLCTTQVSRKHLPRPAYGTDLEVQPQVGG